MENSNIKKLKKEARKHFLAYRDAAKPYDCGLSLMEYISPTLIYHKTEFNKIMDELAKIDPLIPNFRL